MTTGARRADPAYDIAETNVEQSAEAAPFSDTAVDDAAWIEPHEAPPAESRWPIALVAVASLGWIGIAGWGIALALTGRVASVPVIVSWVSVACGPLALIGIGYLLFRRTPRREAERFGATIGTLRGEAERLEALLARIGARVETQTADITSHADALAAIGDSTGTRLGGIAGQLRDGTALLTRQAAVLDDTAEKARVELGVLLADLPQAEARAQALADTIRTADGEAQEGAKRITAMLTALADRSRAAGEAGATGSEQLRQALTGIDALAATSETRVQATAERVSAAIEFSLQQATEAFEQTRAGIEDQGAAMRAMVDQGQVALGSAGASAAAQLAKRIGEVVIEMDALGARLAVHDEENSAVFARLTRHLADLETRYVVIGDSGLAKTGKLDAALDKLRGEVEQLSNAMAAGDLAAGVALKRAEALRAQLDACVDGIDIRLPDALERIEARAVQSHRVVDEALPKVEALLQGADAAVNRLREADRVVGRQAESLEAFLARLDSSVTTARDNAEMLAEAIGAIDDKTRGLSEGSAARLVETMIRVRETAMQAAQRAEEAIAAIVPKAATTLGEASRRAIEGAIASEIEGKIERIGDAGTRAVALVEESNVALLRQIQTMVETTSAIEARVEESRRRLAKSDGDSFGRRMALLIEALKSTAIDVTAMLSSEVSDSAWEAYLKGDRGVFARRAVRLIDGGEAKQITRLYEEDGTFREQVNHYIHDFEAMLRDVLANRDGSPLGVTLLSSDAGKLYVALAQAIERFRG